MRGEGRGWGAYGRLRERGRGTQRGKASVERVGVRGGLLPKAVKQYTPPSGKPRPLEGGEGGLIMKTKDTVLIAENLVCIIY